MKNHVTVIPSDRLIIIEGMALVFDFKAPANLHALQWHNGSGHMEFTDDMNHPLTGQDYADDVLPFVKLWEAEKARLEAEANKPLSVEETIADYEGRIQERLDNFARTLGYDGILAACTYATSAMEVYRIEGQYCVEARDSTWAKAYNLFSAILPAMQAGDEIPVWEKIEAQLPPLTWPEGVRGRVI